MFQKQSNKVKFQDPQLDDYILENSVLKSKLQSKIDALFILSKELDKCSMERDKYKVFVEQLKSTKNTPYHCQDNHVSMYGFVPTNTVSGGDLLYKTRDQNNLLKLELESLKNKLEEVRGDNAALRKQLQKSGELPDVNDRRKLTNLLNYSNNDYEVLIQELEKVKEKYHQIQLDYRATLDEKEELVSDRDYYKNKVQRLNSQISFIIANRVKHQMGQDNEISKPVVDIDSLVTENKYLHERITQLQIEKEIIKRTMTKYKSLLQKTNRSESFKGFSDVMTQKQVREFLDKNTKTGMKRTTATELKSVCLGLFEALNDKSIALQHQRKTNQILANRISELEKTLESWCDGHNYVPIFPSRMLLEEFVPDGTSVKSDEVDRVNSDGIEDGNKNKYSDSDDENKDNLDSPSKEVDKYNLVNDNNKTILPIELEMLVKEALAEIKLDNNMQLSDSICNN